MYLYNDNESFMNHYNSNNYKHLNILKDFMLNKFLKLEKRIKYLENLNKKKDKINTKIHINKYI